MQLQCSTTTEARGMNQVQSKSGSPVMASAHVMAAATQLITSHSMKDTGKLGLPVRACKLCNTQGRASASSLGSSQMSLEVCAACCDVCFLWKNAVKLAGLTLAMVKICRAFQACSGQTELQGTDLCWASWLLKQNQGKSMLIIRRPCDT